MLRNKVSFELHPSFDAKPHTVNNSPNKLVAYDGNLKEINLYNTNDKIREFPLGSKDLPEHVGKESKSSDSNKGNKAKESFLQTNTQGPATLDQSLLNKSMKSLILKFHFKFQLYSFQKTVFKVQINVARQRPRCSKVTESC